MEMKKNIFIILGLVCLLVSCREDFINPAIPIPGKEVRFSADLGAPQSKTLYGEEVTVDNKTSVKVNWVQGDLISVYGNTCDVKQAEYSVNVTTSATPAPNVEGQNYADKLEKTGATGVQWGSETTSDFYAVYPSVSKDFKTTADGVVVPAVISTQQYNKFVVNGTKIQGIPYNPNTKAYGMQNAIMYACNTGVSSTDEDGNPTKVDLRFIPFSTVLKFTIPSWVGETGSDLATDATGKKIVINAITLTSPSKIAGEFDLTINNGGSASAQAGTSTSISILPTEKMEWEYGKSIEFSVFTIPVESLSLSDKWVVTVDVANDSPKKFKLSPTLADDAKLAAGQIHKVNVKHGFPIASEWEWSRNNWLTTVARNVYISDISLPGSWYATDSGYQGGSLADQFEDGIRAFNIDCRLTLKVGENVNDHGSSSVYADKESDATDGTLVLACTGTEKHSTSGWTPKITSIGKTVEEALVELGKMAAQHPDEYIVVVLSVAQKVKDNNYLTANHAYFGTVNPKMMLAAISQVLNKADVKQYLFTGTSDYPGVSPETTVGDVKGKIVIKVNLNTSRDNFKTWNYSAPMLISEGSMANSADSGKNITIGNFTSINSEPMYWSNIYSTQDNSKYKDMKYHYHQAQNTTGSNGYPSVDDRKTAIQSILTESYNIYHNNTHDAMFQIGIGGWTADNDNGKTNLSSQLKPYVYGIVNSMLTGIAYEGKTYTPAPVGIVLMNHSTAGETHGTQDLIDAIIKLNGKYFLNSDGNKPAWPSIPGSGNPN